MVAVGNENRLGPQDCLDLADQPRSVTGHKRCTTPKWSVASSGATPTTARSSRFWASGRIGIEAKNLAQVGLRGPGEQQAVLLGAGHGLFVRIDVPFTEARQPAAGHEAAPRDRVTVGS